MTTLFLLFFTIGAQMLLGGLFGDEADDDDGDRPATPAEIEPDHAPTADGAVTHYQSGEGDAFNIDLVFDGDWTAEEQTAAIKSAEFISDLILADVPDDTARGIPVDDLLITLKKEPIDGASNILAYAQVNDMRDDTLLPTDATLVFDTADIVQLMASGNWDTTVLHEMFHALGFGVFFNQQGLIDDSNPAAGQRFVGENASQEYLTNVSAAQSDPYADRGVPMDSKAHHWDEDRFGDEFMTPILDQDSYVANMTIAALEDMGYDTIYDNVTRSDDLTGRYPTVFA